MGQEAGRNIRGERRKVARVDIGQTELARKLKEARYVREGKPEKQSETTMTIGQVKKNNGSANSEGGRNHL